MKLTSFVLLDTLAPGLSHAPAPGHGLAFRASNTSQALVSLDHALTEIGTTYYLHLQVPSFLASGLTLYRILDCNAVMNDSVDKP